MSNNIFPLIILNARPAAGKTETIEALRATPVEQRIARFHIGPIHVLDDFPMLWTWFEEDRLLEEVFHQPRLHTSPDGYFLQNDHWHLLIHRLCLEYEKWERDTHEAHTAILEFSRGEEHGGYKAAYQHLSDLVLARAVSLYLKVSYAESDRKNRERFNPEHPDSILEHGLSAEKLLRLYEKDDWDEFSQSDPNYIRVRKHLVPYTVFENEDDVTTTGGETLFTRLEQSLGVLWALKTNDGAL
jgi:hypothetical protein